MMKHVPESVRTSDPVIRITVSYPWTAVPVLSLYGKFTIIFVPRHGEAIGGDIEMLGVCPCVCVSVRPSQSLLAR